uniref:Uncharacterized protein n=1 Tax=Meloidogyne floridensis TaxID=298350 RepID=A0A915NUF6_9BILA
MDATLNNGSENGSLKAQKQATNESSSSAISTHIRIQKCITREELSRWDLAKGYSTNPSLLWDEFGSKFFYQSN